MGISCGLIQFSLFLIISFCWVLLLSFRPLFRNTLKLPACWIFSVWCPLFFLRLMHLSYCISCVLGVFCFWVFFPVSSCPLTEDFILSCQFKVLLPRTIIFSLSKLVTTVIKKNLSMLWRLCFVFLTPPPFRLWFTTTVLGVLGFIQPWEWQWITYDVKQVRLNLTMLYFGNYKPQTPLMDI